MCGIVVYFGDAENPLSRILTGMWAIIYRAPDSTGVGVFGDELERVRTRKAVGSVAQLIDTLSEIPIYPVSEGELFSLGAGLPEARDTVQAKVQRQLLLFEGLSLEMFEEIQSGARSLPTWAELMDESSGERIKPGFPGALSRPIFRAVRTAGECRAVIKELVYDYDLPPLAVKAAFRNSLQSTLRLHAEQGGLEIPSEDILQEFELLFDSLAEHEKAPRPVRLTAEDGSNHPYARKYVWKYLTRTRVALSSNYNRDGIACLFHLLDSLILTRTGKDLGVSREVQNIFRQSWPQPEAGNTMHWQTLYRVERAANVYGLAAAAAMTYLQREKLLPPAFRRSTKASLPPGHVPGQTHPLTLRCLSQPIIAHGRWAIQSQVNIKNTHPFIDDQMERCVAINGQFSSEVEARVKRFLTRVVGIRLESENSTEYFVQLWGHYFRKFSQEQEQYQAIRSQVELDLDDIAVGSQAIDHAVYHLLQSRDRQAIDELAFNRAMQVMIQDGGQVAVTGISLQSPDTVFAASHNRPLFVVQRLDSSEFMVVSDINAALGLFPQAMIQDRAQELRRVMKVLKKRSVIFREQGSNTGSDDESQEIREARLKEAEILKAFQVRVTPLEGERLYARIKTEWGRKEVRRRLTITDFEGQEVDVEPFTTYLTPIQIKKDLNRSFYETHLHEIPDRIQDILGSYVEEDRETALPRLEINQRIITRRFGKELNSLRRLFLVGMGATFHIAAMVKNLVEELVPEFIVVVLSPVEVEDVSKIFNPDRDLAVLLSWSGTTADMVQFAKDLLAHNVIMIGVSEKPFADMSLVVRKSGGVIPVFSGEEVTVSGVKSNLCMLTALTLLGLHFVARLGYERKANAVTAKMKELPKILHGLLEDESLRAFCRQISESYRSSQCHLIVDAEHSVGTGAEIALKLEENSWTSMGKTVDYRDLELKLFRDWKPENLVLINATNRSRLQEALLCMEQLQETGTSFVSVTFEHESLDTMRSLSQGSCVALPKVEDVLQPFVDLVFYYQFGLFFGLSHGRSTGDFPRNRAKSVTASRSRPQKTWSPTRQIKFLNGVNEDLISDPDCLKRMGRSLEQETVWEEEASAGWERSYYEDLRWLCSVLAGEDPLSTLVASQPDHVHDLARLVMEHLPVDGEIVLLPLDKGSVATARNVAQQWGPLLGCPLRVESPGGKMPRVSEDALVMILAVSTPDDYVMEGIVSEIPVHCLWFGPGIAERYSRVFDRSMGCWCLREGNRSCEPEMLYAAVSLLMIRIWQTRDRDKAGVLSRHFQLAGLVVAAVLNHSALRQALSKVVRDNQGYSTGLFVGPASGNGLTWVSRFDMTGRLIMEWYPFGESSHGPLVTVDSQVAGKFVPLRKRSRMCEEFGQEKVEIWERDFLRGSDVDSFLKSEPAQARGGLMGPFFAQGQWYLPVLHPDYDPGKDNLVVIDASSERYLGQAMDELSTFGCRFARTVVISQEAFRRSRKLDGLSSHPVGHVLLLPALDGDRSAQPVTEFLLPFAVNILGVSLAARTAELDHGVWESEGPRHGSG